MVGSGWHQFCGWGGANKAHFSSKHLLTVITLYLFFSFSCNLVLLFMQLLFSSFSSDDEDYEGYEFSLSGQLSEVRIVYLNRFIQEVSQNFARNVSFEF